MSEILCFYKSREMDHISEVCVDFFQLALSKVFMEIINFSLLHHRLIQSEWK